MAKYTKTEIEESKAQLREWFAPESEDDGMRSHVYIIDRGASRSNMSAWFDVYAITPEGIPLCATFHVARACGIKVHGKREHLELGGCGYSKSHEIVSRIEHALEYAHGSLRKEVL